MLNGVMSKTSRSGNVTVRTSHLSSTNFSGGLSSLKFNINTPRNNYVDQFGTVDVVRRSCGFKHEQVSFAAINKQHLKERTNY